MPRQSRGRSSSTSAPKRSSSVPAQQPQQPQRQVSGVPATQTAAGGQPSVLGGMMQTAGSVAMGSVMGHGISSMLFGGSGSPQTVESPTENSQSTEGPACNLQAKDFTRCLEATNNDFGSCGYYLEQLKACQAAAQQYR